MSRRTPHWFKKNSERAHTYVQSPMRLHGALCAALQPHVKYMKNKEKQSMTPRSEKWYYQRLRTVIAKHKVFECNKHRS
jgi:hypothetical protein